MPVLIVEDDDDTRESLQTLLSLQGLAVSAVQNGQEAWELLHDGTQLPSVILMDLMMPVMSGWQLRERMMAEDRLRRIPVIVMSATADSSTTLEAAAVLRKPVDYEAVARMVGEYCRGE